jgi:hypothetical protein
MTNSHLPRPLRTLTGWQPALLAGCTVGGLVAADAAIGHAYLFSRLFGRALRAWPYIPTALAVPLLLVLASCFILRERLWRHRGVAVVVLVMATSHLTALSLGPLNPLVIAILLAVGVWLLDLLTDHAHLEPSVFRTLTIVFFACVLGSAFEADPGDVLSGIISFVPKFLLTILLVEMLRDKTQVRHAVAAMLAAAGAVAVVAIAQVAACYLFRLEFSLADEFYRYANTPFGTLLRASGFSRTANQFVPPMGVVCVMAVCLAATRNGRAQRILFALLACVTAAAVILSVVRGMWVATAVGVVLVPFVVKPRLTPLWFGLLLFAFLAAVASGLATWVIRTVVSLSEAGVSERVDLFNAGLKAMLGAVNGVGMNNFGPFSPTFERYPVHNAPVQIGSELGLPGLVVFVMLLGWIGWRLLRAIPRAAGAEARAGLKALLLGHVVMIVAMQSEPMGYSQFLWIYLGLAEAAAKAAGKS